MAVSIDVSYNRVASDSVAPLCHYFVSHFLLRTTCPCQLVRLSLFITHFRLEMHTLLLSWWLHKRSVEENWWMHKGARKQVQGGALAPPGFCFSNFLLTFYTSVESFASHYSCTEPVIVSFLQSEIQQEVVVFLK